MTLFYAMIWSTFSSNFCCLLSTILLLYVGVILLHDVIYYILSANVVDKKNQVLIFFRASDFQSHEKNISV